MPHPSVADLRALLQALTNAGVEFIVVGGTAAVLHGAPVTTQDLDIVPRVEAGNIDRLQGTLNELDAVVRELANRGLRPTLEHLNNGRQLLLSTRLGPLDCLMELHDGRRYDDLVEHAIEIEDADLRLKVLDLETLIAVKSAAGRAKDRIVVPILLALLKQNIP